MIISYNEECNQMLRFKAETLSERVFPSRRYGKFRWDSIISHDDNELIGFISIDLAKNYSSDFETMIRCSQYSNIKISEFYDTITKGDFNHDLYISRFAIDEFNRKKGKGSEFLNKVLANLNSTKIDNFFTKRVWTFVTEDNPSYEFWEKNKFNLLCNLNIDFEKKRSYNQKIYYKYVE